MNALAGVEVWRGGVNTWECDEMGHLNVRFYVAHAMEGLVGVAAALGLPDAFRPRANATLLVRDHHIRFLKEARGRAALHMVAGVLDMGECDARILQLLIHSATGELAATFQTLVVHATAADERPFPWAEPTRRLARDLKVDLPERAAPRTLDLNPASGRASLPEADRLKLVRLGSGGVGAQDCDVFGRLRPEVVVGRVADGVPALGAALRGDPDIDQATVRPEGVGGAVLEYRIAYRAWPRAGDRYEIRSGLAAVNDRTQRLVHWVLDPQSGKAWSTAEAVAVALDLEARRILPIGAAEQQRLSARISPDLAL